MRKSTAAFMMVIVSFIGVSHKEATAFIFSTSMPVLNKNKMFSLKSPSSLKAGKTRAIKQTSKTKPKQASLKSMTKPSALSFLSKAMDTKNSREIKQISKTKPKQASLKSMTKPSAFSFRSNVMDTKKPREIKQISRKPLKKSETISVASLSGKFQSNTGLIGGGIAIAFAALVALNGNTPPTSSSSTISKPPPKEKVVAVKKTEIPNVEPPKEETNSVDTVKVKTPQEEAKSLETSMVESSKEDKPIEKTKVEPSKDTKTQFTTDQFSLETPESRLNKKFVRAVTGVGALATIAAFSGRNAISSDDDDKEPEAKEITNETKKEDNDNSKDEDEEKNEATENTNEIKNEDDDDKEDIANEKNNDEEKKD